MSTSIGLVGLPNVGKTTVFNALTAAGATAENYPFCTVQKNVAVVPVPDHRLELLAACLTPEEVKPTTLEVIDIAGLVRGAHAGEGLGNRFLDDIRNVDAVFHVVRCFHDPSVCRAGGSASPAEDLALVDTELVVADLQLAERRMEQLAKKSKASADGSVPEMALLQRIVRHLEQGHPASSLDLAPDERDRLSRERFLSATPCIVVANTDEDHMDPLQADLSQLAAVAGGREVIVFPGRIEAEIAALEGEDRTAYFAEFGLGESRAPELLRSGFDLLGLITFYTVARNKLHAWRIRRGSSALDAAGLIHSEIAAGFIRADVFSVDEMLDLGSIAALRASGKLRSEGRDYLVRDGDVLYIHFQTV